MKKRMLVVITAICLMFPTAVYAQPDGEASEEATDEVVIYHTNDTYGYLSGDGESIIGIDKVAGLKESTPGAILVDAGDVTQGLPLVSLTKGADAIIAVCHMGNTDAPCTSEDLANDMTDAYQGKIDVIIDAHRPYGGEH